jgi:transposase
LAKVWLNQLTKGVDLMAEESTTSVEATVRDIRRKTRKKYFAEEKVRIVLEGLRGEEKITEICRREGIHQNMYYKGSKEFLEAGKQRLGGDTKREADNQEVQEMRSENDQLQALVAELLLKNRVLTPALAGGAREKSLLGRGVKWDE